jgi:hypothetical protein
MTPPCTRISIKSVLVLQFASNMSLLTKGRTSGPSDPNTQAVCHVRTATVAQTFCSHNPLLLPSIEQVAVLQPSRFTQGPPLVL